MGVAWHDKRGVAWHDRGVWHGMIEGVAWHDRGVWHGMIEGCGMYMLIVYMYLLQRSLLVYCHLYKVLVFLVNLVVLLHCEGDD